MIFWTCSFVSVLLFACKKDATCVCTYREENYATNDTTIDTYTKIIHERKSAHQKACESANFAGTNTVRHYHYSTTCHLQ